MAHDASNNNPKKEIAHALIGIVLLLTIIAGIAVSGWLRPAGNHEEATVAATKHGKLLEEFIQSQEAPAKQEQAANNTQQNAAQPSEAVLETTTQETNVQADATQEATQTQAEPSK